MAKYKIIFEGEEEDEVFDTYEEADSVYKLTPEFDENNNINKIRFSLETDT